MALEEVKKGQTAAAPVETPVEEPKAEGITDEELKQVRSDISDGVGYVHALAKMLLVLGGEVKNETVSINKFMDIATPITRELKKNVDEFWDAINR